MSLYHLHWLTTHVNETGIDVVRASNSRGHLNVDTVVVDYRGRRHMLSNVSVMEPMEAYRAERWQDDS